MSHSWAKRRAGLFEGDRREASNPALVGRDFARKRSRRWLHFRIPFLPILAGLVLGSLVLASLRTAIVRTKYALGDAAEQETQLLERERGAIVSGRALRDPRKLHEAALAHGFVRPERVIDLAAPARRP